MWCAYFFSPTERLQNFLHTAVQPATHFFLFFYRSRLFPALDFVSLSVGLLRFVIKTRDKGKIAEGEEEEKLSPAASMERRG